MSKKINLFRWVKYLLLLYISLGITLYFLQEKFLFHPTKLSSNYSFKFNKNYEEIVRIDNENDTINLIKFFTTQKPKKGILLYYHGNMNNIAHYENFVNPFLKNGYDVWMQDYPTFGKSTGKITEQKLYKQAMLVANDAAEEISKDSIVIYGKSLGTGIAAYVASNTNAKQLILETPYYSIPSMFAEYAFIYPTSILSKYKIPTFQYLQKVKYPITIFHGTNDGVIPLNNAEKLVPYLNPTDIFVTIQDADHININSTKVYFNTIDSLL